MEVTGHPCYTSQKVFSYSSLVKNTRYIENLSLVEITRTKFHDTFPETSSMMGHEVYVENGRSTGI